MSVKDLPFTKKQIEKIMEMYPTPFHIYHEKGIRENARRLLRAFSWNPGFREFFAVKATPNPYILKICRDEGFGADCSSLAELILAERAGITGENIMFSSNDTPAEDFVKARSLGAIINLDDLSHISFLEESAGLPDSSASATTPGTAGGERDHRKARGGEVRLHAGPAFRGLRALKRKGVQRFGLHTMVASNELDPDYFIETAPHALRAWSWRSRKSVGIRFEFVNLGGGFGIPYRPEQKPVDIGYIARGVQEAYDGMIRAPRARPPEDLHGERQAHHRALRLPRDPRAAQKSIYKNYIGLDACMANLMRPGMYGAYHHITVMGKETRPATTPTTSPGPCARTTTSSPSTGRCRKWTSATSW